MSSKKLNYLIFYIFFDFFLILIFIKTNSIYNSSFPYLLRGWLVAHSVECWSRLRNRAGTILEWVTTNHMINSVKESRL